MKRYALFFLLCYTFIGIQAQLQQHPWQGKRIAYIGDSVTDPNLKKDNMKHYWALLHEWLQASPLVYAVSGHTFENGLNSLDRLHADHGQQVDAIVVFLGTNDFNSATPLGEFFSESKTQVERAKGEPRHMVERTQRALALNRQTVKGRINLFMQKVRNLYPTKQVVLLTPMHRGYAAFSNNNIQPDERYENECGYYIHDVAEVIRQAGQIWSVPVIDLFGLSGLTPYTEAQQAYFFDKEKDLLHPNAHGHERIAKILLQQSWMLPIY
jgi:lysophospholipase L1-like esterase